MNDLKWRFPLSDDGVEQGINDSGIATFKGSKLYNNLAREICQNSLDAKDDSKKTVIVEFNSKSVKKLEFEALFGLSKIIDSCSEYWKKRMEAKLERFLSDAKNTLSNDEIELLVISDYNTTGLSGAKAETTEKSVWKALTHSNGVTQKNEGSAGSYGIGKSAPFACSSLRTVFYNSYSKEDNVKAFQGVSRLITHFDSENRTTQGIGYFQNASSHKPIYEFDKCEFRDIFARTKYGTDVIIAGFKTVSNWKEIIERAVIYNFFVSIYNEELIVKIDNLQIDKSNLKARIEYYAEKEKAEFQDCESRITTIKEFYSALVDPDLIEKGTIIEKDDVTLFIKKDETYSKSIAEMRSIGMLIRTRHRNIMQRYAAVMIVNDGELNNLLKDIEPPQHDKWDPDLVDDDIEKQSKAQKSKSKLISWTNDTIVKTCESEPPEELDLDGVSAYLPYDEEDKSLGVGDGDTEESNSNLDNAPEFGKPDQHKQQIKKTTVTAKKVKGKKDDDFEPHNGTSGGSGTGTGGIEDADGDKDVTAISNGGKTINLPKVLQQRIIKMPEPSTYRVSLTLEENCNTANISVKSIGDDGKKENIEITGFKFNGIKKETNSKSVSITNLIAKQPYELFLYLKYSERMLLELIVS